jgi:hypothetical protein
MSEKQPASSEELFADYLLGRVSRAQMFKAIGAGVALAAVPAVARADGSAASGNGSSFSFPFFPQAQGTYTTELMQDVFNVVTTFEHVAVTILTTALTTAASQIQLNALATTVVQSFLAQDVAHLEFWVSLGGKPITTNFTIPPAVFGNGAAGFFRAAEANETLETGGYMTATREFAELGQPTLAKNAYQVGAIEAQHLGLIRGIMQISGAPGYTPASNKAFATDLFLYIRDAAAVLHAIGLIGGSGTPVSFPGTDAALAAAGSIGAAVIQKSPNNASSTFSLPGFPGSIEAERT